MARVVVTGLGVVAPIAVGGGAFASALRDTRGAFSALDVDGVGHPLPVAPLDGFVFADALAPHRDRCPAFATRAAAIGHRSARTVQTALVAALEAIEDAGLASGAEALAGVGVVVAGQNVNQRLGFEQAARFAAAPEHVSPAYAMHYLDTDHVGALSEMMGARGEGMTIGGASASGNVAMVHAMRLLRAGYMDACLVVGAMTDLSPVELVALHALGALAGERFAARPADACRPFDRDREGFVYGPSCACLVLESASHAARRGAPIWAELLGGSIVLDGRRTAEPSASGEAAAMRGALASAGIPAESVYYLNAHGTASVLGDPTELDAATEVFGDHLGRMWVNSTKGLVGHGITSAGVVEAAATLVQMRHGFVHGNRNLSNPLRDRVRFAPSESVAAELAIAMSNSFGFGGFNSSIVFARRAGD